jgi:hypothetical protein
MREEASAVQIVGTANSVTVVISTEEENEGLRGEEVAKRGPTVQKPLEELSTRILGLASAIEGSPLLLVLGVVAVAGLIWLVKRHRRTGKWLKKEEPSH